MRATSTLLPVLLVVLHALPALSQSISLGLQPGLPAPTLLVRADYDATHGLTAGDVKRGTSGAKLSRSRARGEMPVTNAERLRQGLPLKEPKGVSGEHGKGDVESVEEDVLPGSENASSGSVEVTLDPDYL